jgi:hypothetical protein
LSLDSLGLFINLFVIGTEKIDIILVFSSSSSGSIRPVSNQINKQRKSFTTREFQ